MKCLFFDHSFHKQTRSSDFFISLISKRYDVEIAYIDPSDHDISSFHIQKARECDLIIFWQILPIPSTLYSFEREKVLLIPMYDACCILPVRTWIKYKQYRFISFSRRLHNHLVSLGIQSLCLQYVPVLDKVEDKVKDIFPTIFIWKRTPNLNLNKLLPVLERNGIKKVICHGFSKNDRLYNSNMLLEYTNGWFNNHEEYLNTLTRCHYFLAPRQFEGIGMGFLEAMGLGLCVIAPNESTMNEYINNNNGVLFDSFSDIRFDLNKYEIMSNNARDSYNKYRREWNESTLTILPFLQSDNQTYKSSKISWIPVIKEEVFKLIHIRIRNFVRRHLGIQDY